MAISETSIANMALARIGAGRINNIDTDDSTKAIQCRLHYSQVRDALLRSHWWRFATDRVVLSQDASDPDFEWDNQFVLPNDFLRMKNWHDDNGSPRGISRYSYSIEGDRFLTNEDSVSIVYIKQVTDPAKFDSLFVEVLVLSLAVKISMPLSDDKKMHQLLQEELFRLISHVRTVDRQETNTVGRNSLGTWLDSRMGDTRIPSRMGG